MRELTLRVAAADVEDVLDAVLPALPGGAHLRHEGEEIELTIAAAPGTPDEEELRRLAGSHLIELSSAEASDDWRERRLGRYEPLIVAGRFLVRPDWAPPGDDPSLIEIVLEQSTAFGTGMHPTTQACLAVLAEISPGGSFADYGCGSGVLSIAAGQLGWSPIVAVDIDEASLAAARDNAARNGVEIDARRVDLTFEPPPAADTIVANIPPAVQLDAGGLPRRRSDPGDRLRLQARGQRGGGLSLGRARPAGRRGAPGDGVVGPGPAMNEPHGQVRTEVPAAEEGAAPVTVISAGRDVEQGARSMLILAEGLFRLDVIPHDDSLQTILRNLSPSRRPRCDTPTSAARPACSAAPGK